MCVGLSLVRRIPRDGCCSSENRPDAPAFSGGGIRRAGLCRHSRDERLARMELARRRTLQACAKVIWPIWRVRSIQHAEDSFDLLDASILGAVSRLETDGADPATLAKLQNILRGAEGGIETYQRARHRRRERRLARVVRRESGKTSAIANSSATICNRPIRDAFIGRPVKSLSGEWIMTVSRRFQSSRWQLCRRRDRDHRRPRTSRNSTASSISARAAPSRWSRTDGISLARRPDDGNVGRDVSGGPLFKAIRSGRAFRRALFSIKPRWVAAAGLLPAKQSLSLHGSGHQGAGRGARAMAPCRHHPHDLCARPGRCSLR